MRRAPIALSLFWRTFVLLGLLLAGGIFAWVQALRALEFEPRAVQEAQQIASLVNLSRSALSQADGINRITLLKSLSNGGPARVRPREPGDRAEPFEEDRFTRLVARELRAKLGADSTVAKRVNDVPGLWVDFAIDADRYWLHAAPAQVASLGGSTLSIWIVTALVATLLGSASVARLIDMPLRRLSMAAGRIREGDLDSRLDETTMTSEIRDVNKGFNRMARELAKVEEDRNIMLAGISHDLRTPLARLRLETELSVSDEDARNHMAADIDQLDAIIAKFMDYARPGSARPRPVPLAALIEREASAFRDPARLRISIQVDEGLEVMADDTELGRVFLNLFENARRYGRSAATGVAEVEVRGTRDDDAVTVSVRDRGEGVAPEKLGQITTPFYRGDEARTSATGAGLGLAIVEKSVQRMGGSVELSNAPGGGLLVQIRLKPAV